MRRSAGRTAHNADTGHSPDVTKRHARLLIVFRAMPSLHHWNIPAIRHGFPRTALLVNLLLHVVPRVRLKE